MSTLDSHTNTVISQAVAVKMASKTVMRPILENIDMYLAVADPGEGP